MESPGSIKIKMASFEAIFVYKQYGIITALN